MRETLITDISGERRSRRRYDIDLQLQYKAIGQQRVSQTGVGKTVNMSSSGIAFQTGGLFRVGAFLELSITWPVLLNKSCPLKLVVTGRVVRSDAISTALRVDRHEFRTQGRRAMEAVISQVAAVGMQV